MALIYSRSLSWPQSLWPMPASWVWIGILLVSVGCVSGCRSDGATSRGGPPGRGFPPIPVQTITVTPTELPRVIDETGSLESPQTAQLAAERAGRLVFLDIPEGQEVKAGHVLARIDYEQAQAAVEIAAARYENAQETLARLKTLPAKATSQQALDDAQAQVKIAAAQLADAKVALRKTTVTAPFTGVLSLRQVSLGAYLDTGDPIVRLTQIRPLHLIFSLPQRYVSQVKIGQIVRGATSNCEEKFTARVSAIDPFLDPATRSVRIQAVVPNEAGRLLPGMATAVRLETATIPDAFLIPQEAVIRQGTKRLVYTVEPDGHAQSKEVALGLVFANQVHIEKGLQAGEVVVTAGHQKLRPGAKVEPQPYNPIDNPNVDLGVHGIVVPCEF
ncbi:MAG: efflux RND transporter periplasmic adaptor subunit [Candidatus Binatia bacterium]